MQETKRHAHDEAIHADKQKKPTTTTTTTYTNLLQRQELNAFFGLYALPKARVLIEGRLEGGHVPARPLDHAGQVHVLLHARDGGCEIVSTREKRVRERTGQQWHREEGRKGGELLMCLHKLFHLAGVESVSTLMWVSSSCLMVEAPPNTIKRLPL